MLAIVLAVIATALLSSIGTAALLAWWVRRRLAHRLVDELEPLLASVQGRVRAGMLEAGEELLPRLRSEVEEGFNAALEDAIGRGILGTAVRAGGALGGIFGRSRRDPDGG